MDQAVSTQHVLFEVIEKGGWIILPLILCSLIALAVILERLFWGPTRARVLPHELEEETRRLMSLGRYDELTGVCRSNKSPLARIILAVIKNAGRPRSEAVEAVKVQGKREVLELQRYLNVLGTIAAISPLLGLLGTVFGMIETFSVIQTQGVGNAAALAGGISEALITTAVGLSIAIPSLVFYRHFLQKAKQLIVEVESLAVDVLDHVTSSDAGSQSASTHTSQPASSTASA